MAGIDMKVQILLKYGIGEFEEEFLALILNYATSEKKMDRNELESFVIGIPRELARQLGQDLIERAQALPSNELPETRQ